MDNSELDKIVPYFVKYKHKKRLYYQKILHPVLASQDEISYNKRNRLSIEGKTVTGQKRGSIWKNTAGILAPAVILALFLAGCGVKNENTAAAAVSETVSVPEPAIPGDAGEQQAFCLVTSDLHFTLSDVSSVYTLGKYTPELARAFAEEAAERKPDVILMCGDNTNSSRAEDLEALTDILAPLHEGGCEVILVTGNHDCGFTEEEFFGCIDRLCSVTERDPASYSYAVVTHGCRFLAMDDNTAVPGGERGKYKEETMEWLKRQLAEAEDAGERTVFISHHSLMTAGNAELDDYYRIDEPELAGLLRDHGVQMAFTGHRHSQEVLKDGDFYEIISAPLMAAPHIYGELVIYERAASYRTVPLAIERYGTRRLKEALASEAETSGENLDSIVEAVLGKRYSRAKREEIGKLFAAFMSAYAEGTLADHREAIMGSPNYEDFLEAFAESNYGPWIRYMMETTAEPGNRAVIPLAECS